MDNFGNHIHHLDFSETAPGTISYNWLHMANNRMGEAIRLPIMVARGKHDGPVLGLTAAIHGNELNGIPVIQEIFKDLDLEALRGIIVGVLVVNVPGLLQEQRLFNDGVDLNRITPGKANGTVSQVYIYRFIDRILSKFQYHIDLHTASFGRINSFYIRANMNVPQTARMARLQNAQIIVNNPPNDATLRGAASGLGIPSITVELRDPHRFQEGVIEHSLVGIRNVLYDLEMQKGDMLCPVKNTVLCNRSKWLYTDEGGLLRVFPAVAEHVSKGDLVAEVTDIFGNVTKTYTAPEDAIVVGRSINPLNQTGSRIVHLGLEPVEIPCIL